MNNILPLAAILLIASFTLGMTFQSFIFTPTTLLTADETGQTITYHAAVCKTVTRVDGTVEDLGCAPNLFNQDGMNFTRDKLGFDGGAATNQIDVIALANVSSSGTPSCPVGGGQDSANQTLCGEYSHSGLARATADAIRFNATASGSTAGNWTITRQFTNTGSGALDVNGTGLFNTTTTNETGEAFFAQTTFTTATLQVNDKINITWFIWVT